jgi:hypothetical protein
MLESGDNPVLKIGTLTFCTLSLIVFRFHGRSIDFGVGEKIC